MEVRRGSGYLRNCVMSCRYGTGLRRKVFNHGFGKTGDQIPRTWKKNRGISRTFGIRGTMLEGSPLSSSQIRSFLWDPSPMPPTQQLPLTKSQGQGQLRCARTALSKPNHAGNPPTHNPCQLLVESSHCIVTRPRCTE